jgi:hypothetical protein
MRNCRWKREISG